MQDQTTHRSTRARNSWPHKWRWLLLGGFALLASVGLAGCGGGGTSPATQQAPAAAFDIPDESATDASTTTSVVDTSSATFTGGPLAHLQGRFAPAHAWPIVPIHLIQLDDGRVMAYGTDTAGKQGAGLNYAVWDATRGTGSDTFMVLPNFTSTDIFCSAQTLLPDGQVLVLGGDAKVGKRRNFANADVNLFNPSGNTLTKQSARMAYRRWYATVIVMGDGQQLVLGGRIDQDLPATSTTAALVATYADTPELRATDGSWSTLGTATSALAFGAPDGAYFYPRAWTASDGRVFILGYGGRMFLLDARNGAAQLSQLDRVAPSSVFTMPSVMFAPGKILYLRDARQSVVVDIGNPAAPTVQDSGPLAMQRHWGNATVLADGKVWANGGSAQANVLQQEAYLSELWDPATGQWSTAATAATFRLYHSVALLLPDGTVFTGGGGAPGPAIQKNGEIYYPPYLFRSDGSGHLATRPTILSVPKHSSWDQPLALTANEGVSRVTLVRTGAVTHSFNNDSRFFDLPFTGSGTSVTARAPATPELAPPGLYMLFIWNAQGVPSVASMLRLG